MFTLTSDKYFSELAIGQAFYMPGNSILKYYKVSQDECSTSPTNWGMRFKLKMAYTVVWSID